MAKHLMLNEKPTKWFFKRAKKMNFSFIDTLIDEHGDL